MYCNHNNLKVFALKCGKRGQFDLYLDKSGQRFYLTTHRSNAPLYCLLKDGIRIEELALHAMGGTWKGRAYHQRANLTRDSVKHIVRIVDDFLQYELEAG